MSKSQENTQVISSWIYIPVISNLFAVKQFGVLMEEKKSKKKISGILLLLKISFHNALNINFPLLCTCLTVMFSLHIQKESVLSYYFFLVLLATFISCQYSQAPQRYYCISGATTS